MKIVVDHDVQPSKVDSIRDNDNLGIRLLQFILERTTVHHLYYASYSMNQSGFII